MVFLHSETSIPSEYSRMLEEQGGAVHLIAYSCTKNLRADSGG